MTAASRPLADDEVLSVIRARELRRLLPTAQAWREYTGTDDLLAAVLMLFGEARQLLAEYDAIVARLRADGEDRDG